MSSRGNERDVRGRVQRLRLGLTFKLGLLLSSGFILLALLLFLAAYVRLYTSTGAEELGELRSKMLTLWAAWQTGSMESLQEELALERRLQEEKQFLIRVADPWGNTLFFSLPEYLQGFDPDPLPGPEALQEGGVVRLRSRDGKESFLLLSLRLPDGAMLQVGSGSRQRDRALARFRTTFLLTAIPLALLAFAGGMLFSARLLRPVQGLISAARRVIETGRLDSRLPARGTGDELDELVQIFNRMLQKIDGLVHAMRDSLDNVAHDLKTPLTRLRSTAEAALQPGAEGRHEEALAACVEEADRILALLHGLMDIAEAENGVMRLDRQQEDLPPAIRDITDLYRYAAEEKGVRLLEELPEALAAAVDPSRFRQVLANLLDNAVKYTPTGGTVTVRAALEEGQAVVRVEDTGMGIAEEELPRIWERLYRGDRSRSQPGLGLGLSLVRAVVQAHGGSVAAAGRPGGGSVFTVRLPAQPPAGAAGEEAPPRLGGASRTPAAASGAPEPAAPAPGFCW